MGDREAFRLGESHIGSADVTCEYKSADISGLTEVKPVSSNRATLHFSHITMAAIYMRMLSTDYSVSDLHRTDSPY